MTDLVASFAPAPRRRRERRGVVLRALTVAAATYLIVQMVALSVGPLVSPLARLLDEAPGLFDVFAGVVAIATAYVAQALLSRARERQDRLDRALERGAARLGDGAA